MKSRIILTKAEKREQLRQKAKTAPKGGTLAGELAKIKTSKGYLKRKAK